MPACSFRKIIAVSGVIVLLLPALADAQIVSRSADGGLHVRAPFVSIDVPPLDMLAARGPVGGRRFFGRRRPATPAPRTNRQPQQGQQATPGVPELAPPAARVAAAGAPTLAAPGARAIVEKEKSLPTPEKLAAMDVAALEATLRDVSGQLHTQLSSLQTAAGWQRHLKIPTVVLQAPMQNAEALKKTLAKFDAVAGNPQYAKLAGMPSFIATGATLRRLGAISTGDQTTASTAPKQKQAVVAEEILPTPAEPTQPDATRGERSILKRASR
ncbi:MAG: hypothetical protein GXP26_10820 [Planctomycetes bacterium]|nr:hypothetical protein [Planctomycetota bacterium]